jgi:Fe-S oxidoreductase
VENLLRSIVGLSDSPALSRTRVKEQLRAWGVAEATPLTLALLTEQQRAQSVIIVQDAFTTHFEAELVMNVVELLTRLSLRVFVMPYSANGKPLQVQGFLGAQRKSRPSACAPWRNSKCPWSALTRR